MTFKIAKTIVRPINQSEREVMAKIGATMEVTPTRLTTPEGVLAFARDADAVITTGEPYTRSVIEHLEKCRIIATAGVGYQDIDVEAATEYGVVVTNNPDYCLEEVSDHAMALLLSLSRRIVVLDKAIHAGKKGPEVAQARGQVFRLRGKTLGLVGLGGIPRVLVPKAKGFGMRVIAHDPFVPAKVAKEVGVEMVDFDRLLEESDFFSVHAALTPQSRNMFGLEQFKKMKPTALFVNTARGGLVDETALYTALTKGYLAGAGLDVTAVEPVQPDNPLLKLENVILTGHNAHFSEDNQPEHDRGAIENIATVLTGGWPSVRAFKNPEVKKKFTQRWGR